jgi:hypothetical protein
MKSGSLFAIARDEVRAVRIIDELKSANVSPDQISVLIPETAILGGFGTVRETATTLPSGGLGSDPGILGGALEKTPCRGILTRPEVGRLVGAGPLLASLNAPTVASGDDRFTSELTQAGLADDCARRCIESLGTGKILISVQCDSTEETERMRVVLQGAGAEDIADSKNQPCGGFQEVGSCRKAA